MLVPKNIYKSLGLARMGCKDLNPFMEDEL